MEDLGKLKYIEALENQTNLDDGYDDEDKWGVNREDCDLRFSDWLDGVDEDIQEAYLKRFWGVVWESEEDGLLYYTDCTGFWDVWALDKRLDREAIEDLMETSLANDEDWLYQRTNSPYKERSRW